MKKNEPSSSQTSGNVVGTSTQVKEEATSSMGRTIGPQRNFGAHYLNALKCILFPTVFAALPPEFKTKLEDPQTILTYEEFKPLIEEHKLFFEPVAEKMYCRSWAQMMNSILSIVSSDSIHHLSKGIAIACYEGPREMSHYETLKPCFPSVLYNGFLHLLGLQLPVSKYVFQFELDILASDAKDHSMLDEYVMNNFSECEKILIESKKFVDKEPELKRHLGDIFHSVDVYFDFMLNSTFETERLNQYPLKEKIVEEMRSVVMSSADKNETIRKLTLDSAIIQHFVGSVAQQFPMQSRNYYVHVKDISCPAPKFIVHHIAPLELGVELPKEVKLGKSLMFYDDFETVMMMYMLRKGIDYRDYYCQTAPRDTAKRFYYGYYIDALKMVRGTLAKYPEVQRFDKHILSGKLYGLNTCTPILSPYNKLCKPAHIFVRDLFNFLNYEMNLFRSLRADCNRQFLNFFFLFFKEFNIRQKDTQFCISTDAFNNFLDRGRVMLPHIMETEVRRMYVPTNDDLEKHGIDQIVSKLRENVVHNILNGYDVAIDCIVKYLSTKPDDIDWFKLADEAIYRAFITNFFQFCTLIHNQKQCDDWNMCLMKFATRSQGNGTVQQKHQMFIDFEENVLKKRSESSTQ